MPEIVLDDEQARVLTSALEPIEVRDPKGNLLGMIPPLWTAKDRAEAKTRLASGEPRYTTVQLLEHLRALKRK
jgi:hypothetical protein